MNSFKIPMLPFSICILCLRRTLYFFTEYLNSLKLVFNTCVAAVICRPVLHYSLSLMNNVHKTEVAICPQACYVSCSLSLFSEQNSQILMHNIILIPVTVNIIERVNAQSINVALSYDVFYSCTCKQWPDSAMRVMQNECFFVLENNERMQIFLLMICLSFLYQCDRTLSITTSSYFLTQVRKWPLQWPPNPVNMTI